MTAAERFLKWWGTLTAAQKMAWATRKWQPLYRNKCQPLYRRRK